MRFEKSIVRSDADTDSSEFADFQSVGSTTFFDQVLSSDCISRSATERSIRTSCGKYRNASRSESRRSFPLACSAWSLWSCFELASSQPTEQTNNDATTNQEIDWKQRKIRALSLIASVVSSRLSSRSLALPGNALLPRLCLALHRERRANILWNCGQSLQFSGFQGRALEPVGGDWREASKILGCRQGRFIKRFYPKFCQHKNKTPQWVQLERFVGTYAFHAFTVRQIVSTRSKTFSN